MHLWWELERFLIFRLFSGYSRCWKWCLVFTILLKWAHFIRTIFQQRRPCPLWFLELLYKYTHHTHLLFLVFFFPFTELSLTFVIYSVSSRNCVHHVPILLQSEADKIGPQTVCVCPHHHILWVKTQRCKHYVKYSWRQYFKGLFNLFSFDTLCQGNVCIPHTLCGVIATALNKVGGPINYIFQCSHMNAATLRLLHPAASLGSWLSVLQLHKCHLQVKKTVN